MRAETFEHLCGVLKERSGLALQNDKTYLLESRLLPIARKRGLDGLDGLVDTMRRNGDEQLLRDVTEAMTTNESFFFRDNTPFDVFRETVLPEVIEARKAAKSIRIWCAACSTGQEPYSLAMILKDKSAMLAGWRIEIIGTDLSPTVLEKAKSGIYSQFEVQRGLPIQMLMKYFTETNEMWQIDSAIRGMVKYRVHNLLEDIASLGVFDVIYCRNVLIYFDVPTKIDVLERLCNLLAPHGALFLGGAETVVGITASFKPVPGKRGLYRAVPSRH